MVILLLVIFLAYWRPEHRWPDPPVRMRAEAQKIVRELGEGLYEKIYGKFSDDLRGRWPKEAFVSSVAEVRDAIGEEWTEPVEAGLVYPHRWSRSYTFRYALGRGGRASGFAFDFELEPKNRNYLISHVWVEMLYPKGSPKAVELEQSCELFVSLLAEDKLEEALKMVTERALRSQRPWLGDIAPLYREAKSRGGVVYRAGRWFSNKSSMELVRVMAADGKGEVLQVFFCRSEDGRLMVAGAQFPQDAR